MTFYIQKEIIEHLETDVRFRGGLAFSLGVVDRAIYNFILKYKEKPFANSNLTKKAALEYFRTEGYEEDQVLTQEIPVF
ncbi:hypothetical protein [Chryseobacterium sp. ZHDP1]|uniref:hypothetical protein n=1 Tax=Chryseobacterium sp. ZHDP1 TaxID=2838877 RepID=UPI001BDFEC26|nr:hypothetical protein [Chryseobacterium sp. ZHDP1]QWA38844.1 hypothetical protein KKI44_01120 [Chryseobacterium sp. ZHDP1]